MTRPTLLIALCLLLLPLPALARLAGPLQVGQPSQVRDLAQIRSSQVLRVLVNQSRNSSGEVQAQTMIFNANRLPLHLARAVAALIDQHPQHLTAADLRQIADLTWLPDL